MRKVLNEKTIYIWNVHDISYFITFKSHDDSITWLQIVTMPCKWFAKIVFTILSLDLTLFKYIKVIHDIMVDTWCVQHDMRRCDLDTYSNTFKNRIQKCWGFCIIYNILGAFDTNRNISSSNQNYCADSKISIKFFTKYIHLTSIG